MSFVSKSGVCLVYPHERIMLGEERMEAESKVIHFLGLDFSVPVLVSTSVTCLLILIFCILASRKTGIRPSKLQNAFEYIIDFAKGIIKGSMEWKDGKAYHLFIFTLFTFIFVANIIGLAVFIHFGEESFFSSPTASPIVCLALSLMIALITHYSGVEKMGFKGYIKNSFLSPAAFILPIKIIEEFTNVITLAFRLYGNIFAGEVLLSLIVMLAASSGIIIGVVSIPLAIIWQGFSVAIGLLQAFVFCTLSMVYISHKIEHEG